MDAYLAVVSKREVRRYQPRPVPDDVLRQILEAGRATGSSRNRQPWRFVAITDRAMLDALSPAVSRPANLTGAAAAVAVILTTPRAAFDAGRAAQNMMLAAWALEVGSCPNTPMDPEAVREVLGLPTETAVPTILSLGYPAPGEPRPRAGRDPGRVLARVNRLPFQEVIRYGRYDA